MSLPTLLVPGKHKSYPNSEEKPIDLLMRDIEKTFETSSTYYINGRTGSGKTTILPPRILRKFKTRVLVGEPTVNLAVTSVDGVMRNDHGLVKGKNIGYITGPEKLHVTDERSIIFCTYKVISLMVFKSNVNPPIIIIDEAHTKDINLIELFKLIRERVDIKVIIMSATLDADLMGFYFKTTRPLTKENFAIIDSSTNYDVKIMHKPCQSPEDAAFVIRSFMNEDMENALVFIPTIKYGMNIINLIDGENVIKPMNMTDVDYKKILAKRSKESLYVVFVYGMTKIVPKLCRNILDKFKRPPNVKYIIFGTNALEAGRTIPKLTHLFDFGLLFYRINGPIISLNDTIDGTAVKFTGIITIESEDSRIQREGRVGRTCEGTIVRLYDEDIKFTLMDDVLANQKLMIDHTISVLSENESNDLFKYNDNFYISSFDAVITSQVDWQRANIISVDCFKISNYSYQFNTPLRIALALCDQYDIRSALYISHLNYVFNDELCSSWAPKLEKCLADFEYLDYPTAIGVLSRANETYKILLQSNSQII